MMLGFDQFKPYVLRATGIALLSVALSASSATLTIQDADSTETVTLGTGNSVTLQSYPNGNMTLTLAGLNVTVSGSTNTGGGGTDTGGGGTDTGGGGTDTGGGGTDTGGGGTDTGGGGTDTGGGGTGTGGGTSQGDYCSGVNSQTTECDPAVNFDPWIAGVGEKPYWIRGARTKAIPFTTSTPDKAKYGYLQLTTFERYRDQYTEDVFHVWFSETPDGKPLSGALCEWWGNQAKVNLYWSQNQKYEDQTCFLGTEPRVLYLNAETRCAPSSYKGTCNDNNKQKSRDSYNFDVSRRVKG